MSWSFRETNSGSALKKALKKKYDEVRLDDGAHLESFEMFEEMFAGFLAGFPAETIITVRASGQSRLGGKMQIQLDVIL